MEIKEIDLRLNDDMNNFEENLKKHAIFLKEANDIKLDLSEKGKDIVKTYKERLDMLIEDYMEDIEDVNKLKNEIEIYKNTFNKINNELKNNKEKAEESIKKLTVINDSRWNSQSKENKKVINNIIETETENKLQVDKVFETYDKLLTEAKINSISIKKNEEKILALDKNIDFKLKKLGEEYEIKLNEEKTETDNKFLKLEEDKEEIFNRISKLDEEYNSKLQETYNNLNSKYNNAVKKLNIAIIISAVLFVTIIILISR